MGYNQGKNAALNINSSLNMRYQGLMRCITYICKVKRGKFKELLGSLDTGIHEDISDALASEKIINSVSNLELFRNGKAFGTIINEMPSGIKNEHEGTFQSKTNENFQINYDVKLLQLLSWQLFFGIKRINKNKLVLSKKEAQKKFYSEYCELFTVLEPLSFELHSLLSKKLKHIEEKLAFQPQFRSKDWTSVLGKVTKINPNIDSLREMQDLIGLRVVSLFEKDLLLVEKIIDKNFKVMRRYKPNYLTSNGDGLSKHLIIKVPTPEKYGDISKKIPFILAEIQIMTLAQFTFARVSHSLLYKNESARSQKIKSSLIRVSALLESIDIELSRNFEEQ